MCMHSHQFRAYLTAIREVGVDYSVLGGVCWRSLPIRGHEVPTWSPYSYLPT